MFGEGAAVYPYQSNGKQIFSAESEAGLYDRKALMERLQRFWEENGSEGYLAFQISTAQGAVPVKSAKITITKDLGGGYGFSMTIAADESGNAGRIRLPAPSRAKNSAKPYAAYDIEISAPEYVTKNLRDVAIIEGITSQQPVELQPMLRRNIPE